MKHLSTSATRLLEAMCSSIHARVLATYQLPETVIRTGVYFPKAGQAGHPRLVRSPGDIVGVCRVAFQELVEAGYVTHLDGASGDREWWATAAGRERVGKSPPVLVGMNNPYSDDPKFDLYPAPNHSAGGRLFSILFDAATRYPRARVLGQRVAIERDLFLTRNSYRTAFDRVNVLHARKWSVGLARVAAADLKQVLRGRTVVVVGVKTLEVLGLARPSDWCVWSDDTLWATYALIPHPSGLCREYNDPVLYRRVGDLLLDLFMNSDSILH